MNGSANTPIARDWLCKHTSMATKYARNNIRAAADGVLSGVCPEAIFPINRKFKVLVQGEFSTP
jgi:hypothetical protein